MRLRSALRSLQGLHGLACAFVLAASAASAEPLKLVVPNFKVVGIAPEKASFLADHISDRLASIGVSVTTERALQSLLGLERQKQLSGCGRESESCMAELAASLGTDGLLLGDVARFDDVLQLNLKVISASTGRVMAIAQARVRQESALLDEMDAAAPSLATKTALALHRDPPQVDRAGGGGGGGRLPAYVALGLGGVGLVGASVFYAQTAAAWGQIPQKSGDAPRPLADVQSVAQSGKQSQSIAAVCLGVAVAGGAAGVGLLLFGPAASEVGVAVAPLPGGGAFALGGRW